jgi:transglutaminase-like putative cysteine protease
VRAWRWQKIMNQFLESSEFIDWEEPSVLKKAKEISQGISDDEEIAKRCFEFVRDEIKHSHDFSLNPVTVKASEVLKYKTGYCYAKSHLLAALLRANNIPAGLCYQRLSVEGDGEPFCLHGLNAVKLKKYGWYRIDPRGNKLGVNAQFQPPKEKLAFNEELEGEFSLDGIYSEPFNEVIEILKKFPSETEVWNNLPDTKLYANKAVDVTASRSALSSTSR